MLQNKISSKIEKRIQALHKREDFLFNCRWNPLVEIWFQQCSPSRPRSACPYKGGTKSLIGGMVGGISVLNLLNFVLEPFLDLKNDFLAKFTFLCPKFRGVQDLY